MHAAAAVGLKAALIPYPVARASKAASIFSALMARLKGAP